MSNTMKIAIDGPSGAGKSTIAKAAAGELGFIYVDTGAMYRTVALNAIRMGVNLENREEIVKSLSDLKVTLGFADGTQRVYLNGEDVSDEIRLPEVSMAASKVSAVTEVRKFLFDLQRNIADTDNCLMDGRDIGTVVLPDAQVKIFLTASSQVRAKRRCKELLEKGVKTDFDEVLRDIEQRDYNDSHREIAPLKPTDESIIVDTSDMDLKESVDAVLKVIRENS